MERVGGEGREVLLGESFYPHPRSFSLLGRRKKNEKTPAPCGTGVLRNSASNEWALALT